MISINKKYILKSTYVLYNTAVQKTQFDTSWKFKFTPTIPKKKLIYRVLKMISINKKNILKSTYVLYNTAVQKTQFDTSWKFKFTPQLLPWNCWGGRNAAGPKGGWRQPQFRSYSLQWSYIRLQLQGALFRTQLKTSSATVTALREHVWTFYVPNSM